MNLQKLKIVFNPLLYFLCLFLLFQVINCEDVLKWRPLNHQKVKFNYAPDWTLFTNNPHANYNNIKLKYLANAWIIGTNYPCFLQLLKWMRMFVIICKSLKFSAWLPAFNRFFLFQFLSFFYQKFSELEWSWCKLSHRVNWELYLLI